MSRAQGILYENAYYHVMNRGAGHREIFHGRIDREIFFTNDRRGEASLSRPKSSRSGPLS